MSHRNRITKPRLIIADEHTLVAEAFSKFLAPSCEVIATVSDGRALVAAVTERRPDVVVLEVAMPLLNGIDAARQIKHSEPMTRIIFVSTNEDPDVAAEAFRAGASAYLLKRSGGNELLTALRESMGHRAYVTPLVTEGMLGSLLQATPAPAGKLTMRQREVLQLLAEGKSMKEAAALLSVTTRTVAFHKYRMMAHLKIRTNAELIQYAIRQHVI